MLSGLRVLIVESEAIIAMDVQRAVEEAQARETVFATSFGQLAGDVDGFGRFDLAIVTPLKPGAPDWFVLEKLLAARPAIVVSAADPLPPDHPLKSRAEIIYKPFLDEELLEACRRALANRGAR